MFPSKHFCQILFIAVCYFHCIFSCALKQSTGRREDIAKSVQNMGIYDKKFERPLYNKDNKNGQPMCHCSLMDNKTYTKPSYFYVYSPPKADKKTKIISCIATVIASNLLLVSHQCLIYFKQHLNIYETWKNANGPKHTPNYTSITIGFPDNPKQLTIKEIILNPIFALSSTSNDKLYEEDVAIIVVNENIFETNHTSVCLPQVSSRETFDIFYQTAIYSGVGGLHLAKKNPPEDRVAPDSVTLPGAECDKDDNFGFKSRKDTICVKFRLPPPLRPGGSLTIKSKHGKDDKERNFLVGIATQVGLKVDGNNIEYAYFTNLIPLIKYIEYYAKKYESTWCETPRFVRSETRKTLETYEWEKPNTVPARDESLDCACGILNGKSAQARISGGTTTVPYQYPWMAKIFSQWGPGQFSLCGGSIINDRTILTAAHCVVPTHNPKLIAPEHVLRPENADVFVGSHELQNDPNEKKVKVKEIHVFPHFFQSAKLGIKDTDVAILILEQPLDFLKGHTISDKGYRPVCLPKENPKLELINKTALTIGWGFTKWVNPFENYPDPGTPADQLQQLTLPILPLSACSKISYYQVTRNMICAGHLNVTKSSLEGDSGGPIMIQNEDKSWLQVGTVSYGDTEPIYDYDTGDVTPGAHATLYANLQTYTRFIDYHSSKAGAKWCKPSNKRKRRRKRSNFVKGNV